MCTRFLNDVADEQTHIEKKKKKKNLVPDGDMDAELH